MSLFAGYAGTPSSSAYLEMWQDIQLNHIDWETWEYPPDEEICSGVGISDGGLQGSG